MRDLLDLVLPPDLRPRAEALVAELRTVGADAFLERHPELDRGDLGRDVDVVVTLAEEADALVWCDWSGQEEQGALAAAVTRACQVHGLPAVAFDPREEEAMYADPPRRGDLVPRLLQDLDRQLDDVGTRLVNIDLDSDAYQVVPVAASAYFPTLRLRGDGWKVATLFV